MELIYWIKFDKNPIPEKIIAKDFLEFLNILKRLTERTAEPFEWIIRDYR